MYFNNISDTDQEKIVEIIQNTIDLLDNTHNYDSEEFKHLKAVRDVLQYNADLTDQINLYERDE